MKADSKLLPWPLTIEKISLLYSLNRFFTTKHNLICKPFSVNRQLRMLRKGRIIKDSSRDFDLMNIYFLNRSMHQANEACNKLWSTIEVVYSVRKHKLCKSFHENFLISSVIPTLHYANISAMLSILSLFGVASLANKGEKLTFYNIIRTINGILLIERNKYLAAAFGKVKHGWHSQIIQTYQELQKSGVKLPKIDIAGCKTLLRERNKLHYDILGQLSMREAYGITKYFGLLPIPFSTISTAIKSIHEVVKPIPNGCDRRFQELSRKLKSLLENYEIQTLN